MPTHSWSPPPAGKVESLKSVGKVAGGGCMILFSLPFAIPGLALLFGGWLTCWNIHQARNWEQASATIETVPESADDLSTLEYRYRWDGQWYSKTGHNSTVLSFDDNETSVWERARDAKEFGEQMAVWVNPRNPDQSTLERPRASLSPLFLGIFALSHGGVGLALMTGATIGIRQSRRQIRLEKRWPGEPWKWRTDWERGVAKVAKHPWHWLFAYIALVLASFGGWMSYLVLTEPESDTISKVVSLVIIAVSLVAIWLTRRSFVNHRLATGYVLKLPPQGLSTGESYQLDLENSAASAYRMQHALRTWTIRCEETIGSGKSSQTQNNWEGEAIVSAESARSRTISFTLPPGLPMSGSWSNTGLGVRWTLKGDGGGQSSVGPFLLPVFHGRDAEPGESGKLAIAAGFDETPLDRSAWANAFQSEKIDVRPGSGSGGSYAFPPRRHKLPANVSLILGWIFTGIGLGIQLVPFLPARLFGGLFFIAGIAILRSGFWQNYGEHALEATPGQLRLSKTLFGKTRTMAWSADQIASIEVKDAASYNEIPFFVLSLKPVAGRPVSITPLFSSRPAAQAFRDTLIEDLQLV